MTKHTTILIYLLCHVVCHQTWAQVPADAQNPAAPGPSEIAPPVPPLEPAPGVSAEPAVAPGDPFLSPAVPFDYEGITDLDEEVGIIKLSDETGPQVLKMIEMYTDRNILPAQNLPQVQINFDSRTPMTKGEALVALESLLSMNGIALTKINSRFWKAVPAVGINQQVPVWLEFRPSSQPPSEKIYTTLFQLDYLPVREVMTSLQEFGSKSFKPVPFEKANNILVTDSMLNLQRIERLILELDRPVAMSSEKILFIKTQHVDVSEVQRRLSTMAENSLKRYLGGNTKFDQDERTGQLIVVTHEANEALIRAIIENLDIRVEPDTGSDVFDIKNADALEVQKLLAEIIGAQKKVQQQAQKRSGTATASRSTVPVQPTPKPAGSTAAKPATTTAGAADTGERNLQFSEFVTTVADPRSNSILAYGTKSDLAYLDRHSGIRQCKPVHAT